MSSAAHRAVRKSGSTMSLPDWFRRITVAGAMLGSGCSLLIDANTSMCDTDADCAAFGKGFTCTPEKVCSSGPPPGYCVSNALCTQQNAGIASICQQFGPKKNK